MKLPYKNILPSILCISLIGIDLMWTRQTGMMAVQTIPDWFYDFRLPRVLAALFAGISLSVAGLALQSLFRNPLAGPFLTGITPGASFAIGILLLAFPAGISSPFWQQVGLTGAGMVGGIGVLLLQLLISRKTGGMFTLLLTGVLLSYLLGAGVEIMQNIAGAEQVRSFVMWGMGNFDRVQISQLYWFAPISILSFFWILLNRFKLNAWLPGEMYAQNAGVNAHQLKFSMIVVTGILAGATTAICGPIGFVGLAAPHLAKMLYRSNDHGTILLPTAIWGACLCLFADIVAHNLYTDLTLNVNAICAIIGAPVVLAVVLRNKIQ